MSKKSKMLKAAGKAPRWVRDIAAIKYNPMAKRMHDNTKLGTFGAASEVRSGNVLAYELRSCGLERMAREAEAGTYDKEPGKLLLDLHFAFGLKSLTRDDIGKMGRLQQRIETGEFA